MAVDLETSGQILFDNLYVPGFIKRCADHNIGFADETELLAALQTVYLLKESEAAAAQAQPSEDNSFHKQANALLQYGLFGEQSAVDSGLSDFVSTLPADTATRRALAALTG